MDIALPSSEKPDGRFHVFMQVAMFLAAITGIEIVIIFLPLRDWIVYTVLGLLSAVKFFAVILYFMHLRWDRLFCTLLFLIGLAMGGGTLAALVLLFKTDRSEAATPPATVGSLETVPAAMADPAAALAEASGERAFGFAVTRTEACNPGRG